MTSTRTRLVTAALGLAPCLAMGTELVYVPRNPAFGGSPLYGNVFIQEAQAQNSFATDPNTTKKLTPLEQFNNTLQSIILGRLASAIAGGLFDPTTGNLVPGTIDTSNFTITITDLGSGMLRITTTDRSTGQQTTFEVTQ